MKRSSIPLKWHRPCGNWSSGSRAMRDQKFSGWWIWIVFSIRKSLTARYFDRNLLINVCMTAVSNQMSWWKNKIRDMSSAQISLRFDHDRYTWWPEFFKMSDNMSRVSNQMFWWKTKFRETSSAQISLRFDESHKSQVNSVPFLLKMKFKFGEVIQKFCAIKNLVLFLIKIKSDLFRLSKWLRKLKILKPNI